MLTFGGGARIYLAAGVTDMRKSFNSLSGIVRERLQKDPMSRHLFLGRVTRPSTKPGKVNRWLRVMHCADTIGPH